MLPAPCGARGIVGYRIMEAVWGALSKAVPDPGARPMARAETRSSALAGTTPSEGPSLSSICSPEVVEADRTETGRLVRLIPAGNSANTPVEIAEVETPVRIERYGAVPDTAGPGKYRGAPSIVRDVRLLEDEAVLQLRSDKRRNRAFGLHGGKHWIVLVEHRKPE